jgi:hypothetical protein
MPAWYDDYPRFWSKVHVCSHELECIYCCWPWQAKISQWGYGCYSVTHRKQVHAHRHAWELLNQQTMPPELSGCHWCHNKPCVNPHHIYKGTPHENTQHSLRDGRFEGLNRGSKHGMSKITEKDVIEISKLAQEGWTQTRIAHHMALAVSTINQIILKRTWRHVQR